MHVYNMQNESTAWTGSATQLRHGRDIQAGAEGALAGTAHERDDSRCLKIVKL